MIPNKIDFYWEKLDKNRTNMSLVTNIHDLIKSLYIKKRRQFGTLQHKNFFIEKLVNKFLYRDEVFEDIASRIKTVNFKIVIVDGMIISEPVEGLYFSNYLEIYGNDLDSKNMKTLTSFITMMNGYDIIWKDIFTNNFSIVFEKPNPYYGSKLIFEHIPKFDMFYVYLVSA